MGDFPAVGGSITYGTDERDYRRRVVLGRGRRYGNRKEIWKYLEGWGDKDW